jgi:glycosyltransferase involved in cell wall biosynthesis
MRVSVIVPTYRRPESVLACLEGLRRQELPAFEVLVVHRADDAQTIAALERLDRTGLAIQCLVVGEPGVVAALNAGLARASGDIVAMTDDDAVPQPDWIARLVDAYADPQIGAVGGRDDVYEHGRRTDWPRQAKVNTMTWYGAVIGNSHVGSGPPRRVDSLKGVNMSYRRAAIGSLRFDTRLLGRGAQFANEMMFSFAIRRAGWQILYDPEILVHHHTAQRHEVDQRVGVVYQAQFDMHHNLTLCFLECEPWHRTVRAVLWRLLTGSRKSPGIASAIYFSLRGQRGMWAGVKAHIAGDWRAFRTWRATRGERRAPYRNAAPRLP